jgi:CheY-like chemotaxis protein
MKAASDAEAQLFRKYVESRRVVIADASSVSRASLAGALVHLGAKTAQIGLASSFADAQDQIAKLSPSLVICDYDLGNRCGLELLQAQRVTRPESKDSVFALVTGNSSQSAVARAAEEDVDCFILKPFTAGTLRMSLIRAAVTKMQPSEYLQLIEAGKQAMAAGQIDEGIAKFDEALGKDPSPALAFFYRGQGMELKKSTQGAEGDYLKGLSRNKIHYKCMVGLFEVLMAQKRFTEAYDIIKRISQYFPANPQRLAQVLKLAIITKSYDDVEKYYQVFTRIDERNDEIINYITAALVVCGKYYLSTGSRARGLELFTKAAITANGRVKILKEIVLALCDASMAKDAQPYLARFPAEQQSGGLYLALELLILEVGGAPGGQILDRGRSLLGRGLEDPILYRVLIRTARRENLGENAEQLRAQAIAKWPELEAELE